MPATEIPVPALPAYGIKPGDLLGGTNRVKVDDRGEGRFIKFIPVDGDTIGGVLVELSGGITCAFQNDASLSLAGRITVPVTPWKKVEGSDTGVRTERDVEWICFYPMGGTAGRVDVRGYITYAHSGDSFSTGIIPVSELDPITYGKKCVAKHLQDQGADISALETDVSIEVPPPVVTPIEDHILVETREPVAAPVVRVGTLTSPVNPANPKAFKKAK